MRATFWRQLTPGTTYWRGTVPMKALGGQVLSPTSKDIVPGEDGEPYCPRQEGAAIWQFSGNRTRALFMACMRQQGTRTLVEVDDNYLVAWPGRQFFDTGWVSNDKDSPEDAHSTEIHRRIVQVGCDGVICSTPYLADYYREACPKEVFVCPNSIDPEDWSDPLPRDDDLVRIGWAGSISHNLDHQLVRRALRFASKQEGVEVWLIGFDPALNFGGWDFRYRKLPWADSVTDYFQNLLAARLDVGICAVARNSWSRGKSDIKALEYAMSGAMPLCSEIDCYAPWKGKPALFANSPKEFERAIDWCVRHREEVRARAREAREYVMAERTIDKNIWAWEEAIASRPGDGEN